MIPPQSSLRIDLDGSTWVANAVRASPDGNGMSQWHFEGVADSADRREPFALTLNCHGVFVRGIDLWAWFRAAARSGHRRDVDVFGGPATIESSSICCSRLPTSQASHASSGPSAPSPT